MWKSQRTSIQCLEHQAKLFIRDVVRITPPGHWQSLPETDPRWRPGKSVRITTQSEARRKGQTVVKADIAKILYATRKRTSSASARDIHARFRDKRGRVRTDLRRNGRKRYGVPHTELRAEIQRSLNQVGLLASGWNAAATKFKLKMPQWIARHGSSRGRIGVRTSPTDMRIVITNAVKFAGNVRDLTRRVNWALNNRARQMDKQLVHLALVETAASSGFKTGSS